MNCPRQTGIGLTRISTNAFVTGFSPRGKKRKRGPILSGSPMPRARWRTSSSTIKCRATCSAAQGAPLPLTGARWRRPRRQSTKGGTSALTVLHDSFFYLPLMHSECLTDQDRCVRLMFDRLSEQPDNLRHAQAHREVIRLFGRFPYRNIALARRTTPTEAEFIDAGGYGAVLKDMDAAKAA